LHGDEVDARLAAIDWCTRPALRIVGHRSASFVVVCVYRPPGNVTSAFTEQLSDLLDRLATIDSRYIVAGDFNAAGDSNGLDSRIADVITRHALRQHVRSPTHRDGNVLDLIITRDDNTPRGQLISDVAVHTVRLFL